MGKYDYKTLRKMFVGVNKITIILIVILAVILTSSLITGFIYEERKRQIESTESRLCDAANRDASIVNNLFDNYINTLRSISVYYEKF